MKFEPLPKQQEFINVFFDYENKFILYGGAIRGGKTVCMLATFILCCRLFTESKYVIVRKDLMRIKRTVLPTFYQIVPRSFLYKEPSAANEWTATFKNGSQIMFFAENIEKDRDLNRFKGLEYDSIGIEEMDISREAFNKCFERVGTWHMGKRKEARLKGLPIPPQKVVGTCNPTHGWVKEDIYDKWKNGTLPQSHKYIQSRVYDNKHVEASWIEDKRQTMTPLNFQRFVEGDWEVNINELPFFNEFNEYTHVPADTLTIDRNEPLWFSFDFNINPTTCIIGQKIAGKGIFVHDCVQVAGGTRLLCDKLKIYENFIIKVTGDRSGSSANTAAGMVGGEFNTDYGIIKQAFNLPYTAFVETQTANKLHTYSRSLCNDVFYRLPVFIDKRCKVLINDLNTGQPDKNGKLIKDRDLHKQDAGDAFRYLINAFFIKGMESINLFENTF